MNLQPLFTTARVMQAVYRITSTAILLMYLASRRNDKPDPHTDRRLRRLDRD